MTTEQAYTEGFVKRAALYGFNEEEIAGFLKKATRLEEELAAGNRSALERFGSDYNPHIIGKFSEGTGLTRLINEGGKLGLKDDIRTPGGYIPAYRAADEETKRIREIRKNLREKPSRMPINRGSIVEEASQAAQQAAYRAAKGMRESVNPAVSKGILSKLKSLLRKK